MERQRGTRLKRKKNREFVKEKCGDGETEVEEKKKKKALSDGERKEGERAGGERGHVSRLVIT